MHIPAAVRSSALALSDVIFAPICLGCAQRIAFADRARLMCRRCRTRLVPLAPPCCERCGAPRLRTGRLVAHACPECEHWPVTLRAARSACLLHPPADTLVYHLKYRGWHALARPLAECMAAVALPPDAARETALCMYVPTTARRLRERGYNQAQKIAEQFALDTGKTLVHALERTGARGSQTTLQPAARRANVAGAFRIRADVADLVAGEHVLLVDDVLTTGATASECATAIAAAGARCTTVITFARALDARRLTS